MGSPNMLMSYAKKKDRSNNYGQVLGTVFSVIISTTILFILLLLHPLLNRLLIRSAYFNLPRLPIGFYCSVKLLSHLLHFVLSPNPPCPMLLSIYLNILTPPLQSNPSFETFFFRAAWAFSSLTSSFDFPMRLIRFQKEKVPYHSIRLFATASEGQQFFF